MKGAQQSFPAYVVTFADINKKKWAVTHWGPADYDFLASGVVVPIYRGEPLTDASRAKIPRMVLAVRLGNHSDPPGPILTDALERPFFFSPAAYEVIAPRLAGSPNEFIAVEVYDRKSNMHYGTYYCLHVTDTVDCIDYDNTTFVWGTGIEAAKSSDFKPRRGGYRLVLKKEAIAGHVFWRAPGPAHWVHFASRELCELIISHNFTGLPMQGCEAI